MDEPKGTSPPAAEILEIGGRRWRIITGPTLENVLWMDRLALETHLKHVAQKPGESAQEFATRIYETVVLSGQLVPLLAGMILPAELPDEAWDPTRAAETLAFLRKLRGHVDQAAIRALVLQVILAFFVSGLRFDARFPTASPVAAATGSTPSAKPC